MESISAEKLKLINRTVLKCLREKSEEKIIGIFTETAIKVLEADFGFAWLKKYGQLKYKLAYKSKGLPYNPASPRRKGHNYKVIHNKQPLFMEEIKKVSIEKYDVTPYMKSYVILPISYQKKVYGNMVLCYKQKYHFTEADKNFCVFLGNSTAQALKINRLYSNLGELVERRAGQIKQKNIELARNKIENQTIIQSLGEGLVVTDGQGKIILVNSQAEKLLDKSEDDLYGSSVYKNIILGDNKRSQIPQEEYPVYKVIKYKRKVKNRDLCLVRNRSKIPVSITATPFTISNKLAGTILVLEDITAEKKIDDAKSEIISLASHQLRTPLSAINWYTEALMSGDMGPLTGQQKEYTKEVYQANKRMIELVYDLLNVSRIELEAFAMKISSVDIRELTEGVLKELQPTIVEKNLNVVMSISPEIPIMETDRKIVKNILQNLISNAMKYTPENGKVQITIIPQRQSRRSILVTVKDNGYGIPKESQHQIFNKLYRADNIKAKVSEGSGLGLYITKSFVRYCGGKIWFESKENLGTTFYVKLPVKTKVAPGDEPLKSK